MAKPKHGRQPSAALARRRTDGPPEPFHHAGAEEATPDDEEGRDHDHDGVGEACQRFRTTPG
jgi:hypothetical protein